MKKDTKLYGALALGAVGVAFYVAYKNSECWKCTRDVEHLANGVLGGTLADVFSNYGNCKPCVEAAVSKFPAILKNSTTMESAAENSIALNIALQKVGMAPLVEEKEEVES